MKGLAPEPDATAPGTGLVVRGLSKTYGSSSRFRADTRATVLVDVNFTLAPGQSLGIVGESGSGKSTMGACIAGLVPPTAGSVTLDGHDVTKSSSSRRTASQRRIQMVFQNSSGSLNPRRTVGHSVGLPLTCSGRAGVRATVQELLERVGLRGSDIDRFPHEFSGGQRQRLNIARALALDPDVIVCDEPTSGLDASIQAQICELLLQIAQDGRTSYVFISHDLAVVQMMTPQVLVLSSGRVVESLATSDLLRSTNPGTRGLVESIPGKPGVTADESTRPASETARSRKAYVPENRI